MGETTTLTIRIDEDLKKQLEQAATADDRSVTEFVVRAVKARIAPQCSQCGRSEQPVLSVGLSPQFDAFLDAKKKQKGAWWMTVTILEGNERRVYWGRVNPREEPEGFLPFLLRVNPDPLAPPMPELPVAIPRGIITGWQQDDDARHYRTLVALGYLDGNAWAIHARAAAWGGRRR